MNNWMILAIIIWSIIILPGWWALLPVVGFWAME